MAIGDVQSGYWVDRQAGKACPVRRAEKISKTAWMDLYVDLYRQVYGEGESLEAVIADAESRLGVLKANGIRR